MPNYIWDTSRREKVNYKSWLLLMYYICVHITEKTIPGIKGQICIHKNYIYTKVIGQTQKYVSSKKSNLNAVICFTYLNWFLSHKDIEPY